MIEHSFPITAQLLIIAILSVVVSTGSVGHIEPVTSAAPQPFLLTQLALDNINTIAAANDTAITGNIFNVRNDGSDKDIKDIYSNKPFGRPVQTGDIFVIRNFINNDGVRGALDFVDIMVRREEGFNPFAGDFEYFRMDFDSLTNYAQHPNGIVPTIDNIYDRGTDVARAACVACHRNGGQDFLFTQR